MSSIENRIPPPILFLVVAIAMGVAARWLPAAASPGVGRWLVVAAFAVLALVGPLGIREFRRARTTIDPVHVDRASNLVTTGVFARTRNPMYLSMTCLLAAWATCLSIPAAWIGPVAFALFIHRFQILPEERAMTARFGESYEAYRRRVRRWI